jgi:hypothetical protein
VTAARSKLEPRARFAAPEVRPLVAFAARTLRLALERVRKLAWWLDVAAILLVIRVVTVLARPLTHSRLGWDEKFFVYSGYSILHGQVPYRDFQTLKGPLLPLSEALGVWLFGLEHERFRLFPNILGVGSIAFLVAALIRRGVYRLVAVSIGLLISLVWLDPKNHETTINDTESLLLGYFCISLAFLLMQRKVTPSLSLLGGLFLGATVLIKENFVITAAATWLAFLFLPATGGAPRRERLAYAKWSLAGGFGLGIAVVVYLVIAGGMAPYLRVISVYPRYANSYCTALGFFHPGSFWDERQQEWAHLSDRILNATDLAPWLALLSASVLLTRVKNAPFVAGCGATLVATLVTINIGHCYHSHYFVLAATGLTVAALPGALALSDALRPARPAVKTWVGVAALGATGCLIYPRYAKGADEHPKPVWRQVAGDVREAIEKYSKPNDFILTTGTPDLYFLTGRLGAHETNSFVDELLVIYPGDTDAERVAGMRARLEKTRPKVVVIDDSSWAYPGRSVRTIKSLVDAYLGAHQYVKMGRVYVRPDLVNGTQRGLGQAPSGDVVSDVTEP